MKYIKNSLAIFAFVIAGFAAFAFQSPEANEAEMLFGKLENGSWVEAIPGEYVCINSQKICTAELDQNGQPVPGTETSGKFQRL